MINNETINSNLLLLTSSNFLTKYFSYQFKLSNLKKTQKMGEIICVI